MASDLPSEFDVVVLGTGLPESILAAAFSRNGHTVLHLDKNDYYSSNWASFNIEGIERWKKNQETETPEKEIKSPDLKDGEKSFLVPQYFPNFSRITTRYHLPEEPPDSGTPATEHVNTEVDNDQVVSPSASSGEVIASNANDKIAPPSNASDAVDSDLTEPSQSQFEDKIEDETKKEESTNETNSNEPAQKIWTISEIKNNWRRFNLDLVPKVLYCSGQMVDLLIVSDVAKYCEFRTVSQILTLLNGQLEKVPCSRADVFGSKKVTMLEKRLLMKFLTFCAEYDKHSDQYEHFIGKPFEEFLSFRKLTPNIHHFVYHSIAMATAATTTEEGLKRTQQFLQSLGRYGNTAFLFPLYGSGELPQGFCRLCAVFGGVYCLQMSASHVITDNENKCVAVHTTEGQRIACKHLILGPSYSPPEFEDETASKSQISRAILVTNKSVLPSENSELSMMHLLPEDDPSRAVMVLELPPSSMVCPRDSFVVHLTRKGTGDPKKDFTSIIKTLFKDEDKTDQTDDSPCILWSIFFNHTDHTNVQPSSSLPSNVHLLPGPGTEMDMDGIVEHAKRIWKKVCPDEDFLPKPPNPEDIIYVDDAETKVGEGTENAFEDAAEEKDKSDEGAESKRDEVVKDKEMNDETREEQSLGTDEDSQGNTKHSDQNTEASQTGDQSEKALSDKLEHTNIG